MPPRYPVPPGYPPAPPPIAPNGARLADFSDRFLAFLIDYAILAAASMVVLVPAMFVWFSMVFNLANDTSASNEPVDIAPILLPALGLWAGIFILLLAIQYVYRVEMMWRTGQTVGKRGMKLRVIPLEPGAELTRGTAATRFFIELVSGFVPFGNVLDGLWQLWDKPFRQCLHDKVAKTVVVKV